MGDDRLAKRNVAVLFYLQAILGSQGSINMILGGLAGFALAGAKALATLPISIMLASSMLCATPVSLFMGRFGRRSGFLLGSVAGFLGGGFSALGLYLGKFEVLLIGSAFTGVFRSTAGYFRFAAADMASEEFKPKAISWVLAGGLVSAIIGPEIVRQTTEAIGSVEYAGAFLMVMVVNVVGALGLFFLKIPTPEPKRDGVELGRPLRQILTQPVAIVAVLCAMVSYASMTLVMTSTSLAMSTHGFTTAEAADVVRWHIVAMFAPSFFTGSLINRFGHVKVITTGLAILAVFAGITANGVEIENFYGGLIALGLGWNFGFIGATSLLTTAHTDEERAKVQGLNDTLIAALVAAASLASGVILHEYGWEYMPYAIAPGLAVAAASLVWLVLTERRAARLVTA